MKLSQFNFKLPENLIAQHPNPKRDECRLMVVDRKTGKIQHKKFKDLLTIFDDQDVIVLNNTKVFPARMFGKKEKTGAKIEVFLLRELNTEMKLWDVLVDPARKIRVGNKLYFGEDDLVAEVVDNTTSRGRTIRFLNDSKHEEFKRLLYSLGECPLPRHIKRKIEPDDTEWFQTVYAKEEGAVAAPTSGLHFSQELLKRLEIKGVNFAELTLHVSLGTFRTIDVEDLSKHKMDAEYYKILDATAQLVNTAKKNNKKVCAVGSTTLRAMESSVSAQYYLKPSEGWTNLFLHPPNDFNVANSMISNFHGPKSSVMITVAAFCGYDLLMKVYETAIKEKYKFLTYGDAMLVI